MKDFKVGPLWNRLVSTFRKQLEQGGEVNFSRLEPFEINKDYPFDRFLILQPEITPNTKARSITVNLSYKSHPEFSTSTFVDGYRLGAIAIFPDALKSAAKTSGAYSRIISFEEKVEALSFEFAVPVRTKSCVVCLSIDGCLGKEVDNTPATKGMKVVWSGVV